ncbi:hypothetical protein AURDEDRAFT_91639 [Auricularia subglabra TFB-10046 SS5]|nr:hypothetical protein AURDEDRAFT_91639 [Auricularia subglabra TFB-10046 SS5]
MTSNPYNGDEKLVFGIDCGTTMTAVSYVHLLHGVTPSIQVVNRWPYQEEAAGNYKVPTVVRYDETGKAVAFGAEAVENPDGLEGTSLARWFKLHLHPQEMRDENDIAVPPLPPKVALDQVYADFLRFTFDHAADCFRRSTLDGAVLWDRLKASTELVFAIPNGWSGTQQNFIRDAVIAAGVLPANFAPERLSFVSEAEASVHFALEHMNVGHLLRLGAHFIVLDAGGSTVDTTIYRCEAVAPKLRLVEVTSSECVQAGSVFVDKAFENMVRAQLAGSKFSSNEYIDEMMSVFESKAKRRFTGLEDQSIIHFGRNGDNDPRRKIRMGRLTLPTADMRETFEKSVSAIVASVARALRRASVKCETVLLVGGFAESPYLRRALQERLESRGIQFVFSDEPTRKAAAEGATSWRVKQYVSARAARRTYGIAVHVAYDASSPAHYERREKTFVDNAGDVRIDGVLSVLVKKDDVVENDAPCVQPYCRSYSTEPTKLDIWSQTLLSCDDAKPGYWAHDASGALVPGLQKACVVTADLSGLAGTIQPRINKAGKKYWVVDYEIEVFFGRTALCAAIVWQEKGRTKKGPATIIPNSIKS